MHHIFEVHIFRAIFLEGQRLYPQSELRHLTPQHQMCHEWRFNYIILDFWTSVLLIVWDTAGNFHEFFILLERNFHQLQKEA